MCLPNTPWCCLLVAGCLWPLSVSGDDSTAEAQAAEALCARISASTLTIRVSHVTPTLGAPTLNSTTQGLPTQGPQPNTLPVPANPALTAPTQAQGGAANGLTQPTTGQSAAKGNVGVTVATGVSLGKGLIVTFVSAPSNARIRVTLPDDGRSADAQVVVVDHYSGLALLQVDDAQLPAAQLADQSAVRGAAIYTAAGSGLEEPLVSKGIVGGVNRSIGSVLPPVLACDVRTTPSSSGAGVFDAHGKLIGVVAATDRTGWTYAVPVAHVERLLKARPQTGVVVLERRRPVLGLNLAPRDPQAVNDKAPELVEIERIIPAGPADQAGVKVGDLLAEVDGVKIRSVYTAQLIVLRKQPGDRLSVSVRRGDAVHRMEITLDGSGPPPAAQAALKPDQVIGVVQPFVDSRIPVRNPSSQVTIGVGAPGQTRQGAASVRSQGGSVRILLSPAPLPVDPNVDPNDGPLKIDENALRTPTNVGPNGATREPASADQRLAELQQTLAQRDRENALLKSQLQAWAKALELMQTQLRDREVKQQASDQSLHVLKAQLEALRRSKPPSVVPPASNTPGMNAPGSTAPGSNAPGVSTAPRTLNPPGKTPAAASPPDR